MVDRAGRRERSLDPKVEVTNENSETTCFRVGDVGRLCQRGACRCGSPGRRGMQPVGPSRRFVSQRNGDLGNLRRGHLLEARLCELEPGCLCRSAKHAVRLPPLCRQRRRRAGRHRRGQRTGRGQRAGRFWRKKRDRREKRARWDHSGGRSCSDRVRPPLRPLAELPDRAPPRPQRAELPDRVRPPRLPRQT